MKKKFIWILCFIMCILQINTLTVSAATGDQIVAMARKQDGKPYSSSNRLGPNSFDCSGLVWYVCNQLGISMSSGNCQSQMSYGTAVDYSAFKSSFDCSNLQNGDLIFFDYGGDGVADHVGIYSGNGNMIDALTSSYYGYKVVEHTIDVVGNSSVSSTKKFWAYTCGIRRVSSNLDLNPPQITNCSVSNVTSSSFTVNCSANETLSRAYMIVYGPGGNSGNGFDIYNINSSSFSKTINTSDYGGVGDYTVHIYVFDMSGNEAGASTGGFTIGNFKVKSCTVTNKSSSSFTVNCSATNKISRAYMIVYGPGGKSGQGFDIYNINSTSFSKVINTGDYGGSGDYTVHVYIFDSTGNELPASTGSFSVDTLQVNNFSASNISERSFTLSCNTNYKISRAYIIVYGPGGNSGQGFDIYNVNSTSFSKTINTNDYGGTGDYVIHVYVFDNAGNEACGATKRFNTSALSTGFTVSGNTVTNNGVAQTATVIVADYTNGVLTDISSQQVSFTQGQSKQFSYGNGAEHKIFVWDSLSGMKPLCKSE